MQPQTKPWLANRRFGFCRSFGHQWEVDVRHGMTPKGNTVELRLKCLRCKSRRPDRYVIGSGELKNRRYEYVDGYEADGVVTKKNGKKVAPDRVQIRGEVLTQLIRGK